MMTPHLAFPLVNDISIHSDGAITVGPQHINPVTGAKIVANLGDAAAAAHQLARRHQQLPLRTRLHENGWLPTATTPLPGGSVRNAVATKNSDLIRRALTAEHTVRWVHRNHATINGTHVTFPDGTPYLTITGEHTLTIGFQSASHITNTHLPAPYYYINYPYLDINEPHTWRLLADTNTIPTPLHITTNTPPDVLRSYLTLTIDPTKGALAAMNPDVVTHHLHDAGRNAAAELHTHVTTTLDDVTHGRHTPDQNYLAGVALRIQHVLHHPTPTLPAPQHHHLITGAHLGNLEDLADKNTTTFPPLTTPARHPRWGHPTPTPTPAHVDHQGNITAEDSPWTITPQGNITTCGFTRTPDNKLWLEQLAQTIFVGRLIIATALMSEKRHQLHTQGWVPIGEAPPKQSWANGHLPNLPYSYDPSDPWYKHRHAPSHGTPLKPTADLINYYADLIGGTTALGEAWETYHTLTTTRWAHPDGSTCVLVPYMTRRRGKGRHRSAPTLAVTAPITPPDAHYTPATLPEK